MLSRRHGWMIHQSRRTAQEAKVPGVKPRQDVHLVCGTDVSTRVESSSDQRDSDHVVILCGTALSLSSS
jgi:hypothetical protein